ncbi:hypothetical protein PV328_000788, partial [Microctonus aethiopoides]
MGKWLSATTYSKRCGEWCPCSVELGVCGNKLLLVMPVVGPQLFHNGRSFQAPVSNDL